MEKEEKSDYQGDVTREQGDGKHPRDYTISASRSFHYGLAARNLGIAMFLMFLIVELTFICCVEAWGARPVDGSAWVVLGGVTFLIFFCSMVMGQAGRRTYGRVTVTDDSLEFVALGGARTRILWAEKPLWAKIHSFSLLGKAGMGQHGLAVAVPGRQIAIYASILKYEDLERLIVSRCQPGISP